MKHAVASLVLVVNVCCAASGCTSREVCGGHGMDIETRPLEGVLKDVGLPAGAVQCDAVDRPAPAAWAADHRHVELGKNAFEGVAAWQAHLERQGWKETTPLQTLADNGVIEAAARAGQREELVQRAP